MAHIYHGSEDLILTDIQKEDFPSSLSRITATYKCRTPRADALAPLLLAGNRLPDYPSYIIRQNPTRVAGQDGFTTFTSSAFTGTNIGISTGTPAVFGAVTNTATITIAFTIYPATGSSNFDIKTTGTTSFTMKVLSDTITRTFILPTTSSVTTLDLPTEKLAYKILNVNPDLNYFLGSLDWTVYNYDVISGKYTTKPFTIDTIFQNISIVNVNRQSFGGVDEVQVTWGIDFDGFTFDLYSRYK